MTDMQPWTRDELLRFAPAPRVGEEKQENHAAYVSVLAESFDFIVKSGIDTPLRLAHFMAIIGHETGGLTIAREDCTWSLSRMCELWPQRFKPSDPMTIGRYAACRGDDEKLAEMAYGGWNDLGRKLGNTEPGDGWSYRGGGPFQGTGRSWYQEVGDAIGVDLESDPDQIEDPRIAIKVCVWYWKRYRLADFADRNYLRAVQNQINRGNPFSKYDPNGWPSRQRWFDKAWGIWHRGKSLPSPLDLGIGAQGSDVKASQIRLRELGYPCGVADGIFGHDTRRAVAAFKVDWLSGGGSQLEPMEIIGPATREALAVASPIRRPEREAMTVAELKSAGSTEVAAGEQGKIAGKIMLGLGAIGGATQGGTDARVDPTPVLTDAVGWVPHARSVVMPVIEAGQWAVKHWWWVAAISLGVWYWAKGHQIVMARLAAARQGLNMWR